MKHKSFSKTWVPVEEFWMLGHAPGDVSWAFILDLLKTLILVATEGQVILICSLNSSPFAQSCRIRVHCD
jgi:hypothetical protein